MVKKRKSKILIVVMIAVVTVLHYGTPAGPWAIHDFYRRLYYLPIILAAFQFRLKGGFITSAAVVLLYAPHLITFFGSVNMLVINQFLESGMFMVVGLVTGYLAEEAYRREIQLEQQIIKLTNLENYTHNILDSIDSAVMAFNRQQQLTSQNRQVAKLLTTPQAVEQFLADKTVSQRLHSVLAGKRSVVQESFHYRPADGQELFIDLTVYPLETISSGMEGAVMVLQDTTRVKNLEKQVRRSERMAAIGQLASGIAHEIRNPLGIIKTISQTLRQESADEPLREGLEIVEQEIDRANRVIRGILDFAKPAAFSMERLNLTRLLEEMVVMTRKFAEQHQVDIRLKRSTSIEIEGDADRLKQALLNLILNGIQAMDSGGELVLNLEIREEWWAVITITDQGGGIPESDIDRIFDPFFTTREQGTGLGLAITHRILEEHDGRIELMSSPGQGTIVSVWLPLHLKGELGDAENYTDR